MNEDDLVSSWNGLHVDMLPSGKVIIAPNAQEVVLKKWGFTGSEDLLRI